MRIAVLGGTGPEGLGLAARLAQIGDAVIIGSRSAARAAEAVETLKAKLPEAMLSGGPNAAAAAEAEIVVLAFPYEGIDPIVAECAGAFAGKVVIDTIVPLKVDGKFFTVEPPEEGSAGERIQGLVPAAKVVSAFKHQSASHLIDLEHEMEGDVLYCGNDEQAKGVAAHLIRRIRDLRPVDAGDLRAARAFEAITALLLNLNRKHKTKSSIRILGV
ncbi:MAG: NADPH-dependent F420 reductase [Candidatus Binatia bacterium]